MLNCSIHRSLCSCRIESTSAIYRSTVRKRNTTISYVPVTMCRTGRISLFWFIFIWLCAQPNAQWCMLAKWVFVYLCLSGWKNLSPLLIFLNFVWMGPVSYVMATIRNARIIIIIITVRIQYAWASNRYTIRPLWASRPLFHYYYHVFRHFLFAMGPSAILREDGKCWALNLSHSH